MKIGIGLPTEASDGYAIPANQLYDRIEAAEGYGFGGAWVVEHLIQVDSFGSSYLDPMTALASVAGKTDRIPMGTSILNLPLRNPVHVAKMAASLQHLSEERFTLGLGQGYIEQEFDAVGIPYEERHHRFSEGLELVYRLLNEDTVTFDGEFFSVDDLTIEPNTYHPPRVLAAGGGRERDGEWRVSKNVKRRIATVDGWIASSRSPIEKDWKAIGSYLEENGHDPRKYDRVALQHVHLVPGDDGDVVRDQQFAVFEDFLGEGRGFDWAEEHFLVGTIDEIVESLVDYRRNGVDEVILNPAATSVQDLSQQYERLQRHVLPAFQ
jgi:alkanesulfonate monooxygenase